MATDLDTAQLCASRRDSRSSSANQNSAAGKYEVDSLFIVPRDGATIIGLSFREFARAKTTLRPDCGAKALIRSGPFRYSRNPLYVAVALLIIGIGFGAENVWIIVMVIPLLLIMSAAVIAHEEKYLEREFGQEYLDFKKSVRRWI